VNKDVIAYRREKPGFIQVYTGEYASNKTLMEQVEALIKAENVLPQEIAVLSRLYAQMDYLEAEFLNHQLPYRVEGHEPFFKRSEIKTLLDYTRLGVDFHEPLNNQIINLFLTLANKPNRMLSRALLERLACEDFHPGLSLDQLLRTALYAFTSSLSRWQREKLEEYWQLLAQISQGISVGDKAGCLLREIVDQTHYLEYFQNYYGDGEHADGKIMAVQNFLEYVGHTQLTPVSLLDHIARLDTTQGVLLEEQVVFTTIFRTKGLEYDYVFLPETNEGALPYLKGASIDIYDTQKRFLEDPLSDKLEGERRLFYVAITRARKGVFIGTGNHPSRFISEIQLEEVRT
jgi:DNA helicase-2/ATP-dependent DNA helicase PcrA